jgi:hypothetical protein
MEEMQAEEVCNINYKTSLVQSSTIKMVVDQDYQDNSEEDDINTVEKVPLDDMVKKMCDGISEGKV